MTVVVPLTASYAVAPASIYDEPTVIVIGVPPFIVMTGGTVSTGTSIMFTTLIDEVLLPAPSVTE